MVEILCLANSVKLGGRCVAGIEMNSGRWVRPVSEELDGTLPSAVCEIDGIPVRPLDVLHVPLEHAAPRPHQPENWTLGPGRWTRLRRMGRSDADRLLAPYVSNQRGILGTTDDRVLMDEITMRRRHASLALVRVSQPEFRVEQVDGALKIRCAFFHEGVNYVLSVTEDRDQLRHYGLPESKGSYTSARDWYLTISLTEPWNGACHKIVAGAIPVPQQASSQLAQTRHLTPRPQPESNPGAVPAGQPAPDSAAASPRSHVSDELIGLAGVFASRTGSALEQRRIRDAVVDASIVLANLCRAYLAAYHPLLIIRSSDGGLDPEGLLWALQPEPKLCQLIEPIDSKAAARRCCFLIGEDDISQDALLNVLDTSSTVLGEDRAIDEEELDDIIECVAYAADTILTLLGRDPSQFWGQYHEMVDPLARWPRSVRQQVADRWSAAENKWMSIQDRGEAEEARDRADMPSLELTEWQAPCPVCDSYAIFSGELALHTKPLFQSPCVAMFAGCDWILSRNLSSLKSSCTGSSKLGGESNRQDDEYSRRRCDLFPREWGSNHPP